MLQSMGSQRVIHDLVTEQQQLGERPDQYFNVQHNITFSICKCLVLNKMLPQTSFPSLLNNSMSDIIIHICIIYWMKLRFR